MSKKSETQPVFTSREAFKNFKPKPESVEIKDFGTVFIRHITGAEFDELCEVSDTSDGKKASLMKMATFGIGDENGERLFATDQAGELDHLSIGVLQRIIKAMNRVNGTDEKALEKLEGNS